MRAFILALAGLFVIGFRHPAILGITVTECRLWFIVINTMYSTGTPGRNNTVEDFKRWKGRTNCCVLTDSLKAS